MFPNGVVIIHFAKPAALIPLNNLFTKQWRDQKWLHIMDAAAEWLKDSTGRAGFGSGRQLNLLNLSPYQTTAIHALNLGNKLKNKELEKHHKFSGYACICRLCGKQAKEVEGTAWGVFCEKQFQSKGYNA